MFPSNLKHVSLPAVENLSILILVGIIDCLVVFAYFMTVLENLDGTCLGIELVSQKHGLGISVPYLQRILAMAS